MDRRRTLIIAGVATLLLVAVALWLALRQPAAPAVPPSQVPTSTGEDLGLPPLPTEPGVPQPGRTGATVAARVWAERFASWSNEDGLTNLQQLDGQSTEQVRAFLATYRQQLMQRYPVSEGYRGVTGRALSPQLGSYDEGAGTATVSVAMQLAESTSTVPTVYNRTLDLRLVRSGTAWLVDYVKWAE